MNEALQLLNFADAQVSIDESAKHRREDALLKAQDVQAVADEFDNEIAVDAVRSIKQIVADVEKCRKTVKAPVLQLGKSIDEAAKGFVASLNAEAGRVNRLISGYADEQRKIAMEAERKRQEQARIVEQEKIEAARKLEEAATQKERAKAREQVEEKVKQQADLSLPVKTEAKPSGLTVRRVKTYEVVDIRALLAARPDLVVLSPNHRSITEAIKSTDSIPGLKISEETKTSVRK